MALSGIPISINECIGDSLHTINAAFTALDFRTASISPPTTAGNVFITTISGGNIIIGGNNVTTIISGDVLITEDLYLSGNAYLSGDLVVDGVITGSLLSSTGDLVVDGNGFIAGTLTACTLSATCKLVTDGDLEVFGDAYIHGKLTAAELSSTGPLTVDGNTTLKGNLSVWGNSFLGDQCSDFTQIQGTLKLPCVNTQNAIEFNKETSFSGTPNTDGVVIQYRSTLFNTNEDGLLIEKTDFNNNPVAGGIAVRNRINTGATDEAFAIRGNGNVGIGTFYPNKRLTVIGEISATNNTTINGNLRVDGNTVLGDGGKTTTIKDDLNINGDTVMDGDLEIKGNLTVLGEMTQLDTEVQITSATEIINHGTTTALIVNQLGDTPVVHFKNDNNSALYIDGTAPTDGFVGIFTTNPTERLEVNGNIALTVNSGGHREIKIPTTPPNSTNLKINATNNTIIQETAGRVAIRRNNPATELDVNGDVTITDKIIHSGDVNTHIAFPVDDNFAITTNGNERIRVLADGKVGINKPIPSTTLHVGGDVTIDGDLNLNGTQSITVNSTDPALRITQDGSGYALRVDDVTGDTTPFVVDADGKVGIGRTAPATELDVNGDVTITDKIIHSLDTDTCIRFPADDNFAIETNGNERIRVLADGKVGIGISTPLFKLDVDGEIRVKNGYGDSFILGGDASGDDFEIATDQLTKDTVTFFNRAGSAGNDNRYLRLTCRSLNLIQQEGPGLVPTGAVIYTASNNAPFGYYKCDGAALVPSTVNNPLIALLNAAGNPYGTSGGNPRVPDLRGIFIRGAGTNASGVAGVNGKTGAFGNYQADQFASHSHPDNGSSITGDKPFLDSDNKYYNIVASHRLLATYDNIKEGDGAGKTVVNGFQGAANNSSWKPDQLSLNLNLTNVGGTETNPANLSLTPIIKL